ncbi:MAG: tyrosine--tRNA ligase, partial [candidate division Zixibacteria bacterium]
SDVEIGGTDQTFNVLAARTIQEAYGVPAQAILTIPLLVGLDGSKKMSKSLGNYIGIEESAREIFGKAMSIPDELIYTYFELTTEVTLDDLKHIKAELDNTDINPMSLKKELAAKLVDTYHPSGSGQSAREEFERVFSQKKLPDEMPEIDRAALEKLELDPSKCYLVHLLTRTKLCKSAGEARKLISAGAVSIDGAKVSSTDHEFEVVGQIILKVGKRRFLKLIG